MRFKPKMNSHYNKILYWPHITHTKWHDYCIYLLPVQFLSVTYNHWTSHDYGQTAPVKERHI